MKPGVLIVTVLCGAVAAAGSESAQRTKSSSARHATPVKVLRYAQRVIAQHDASGDGSLQPEEWAEMNGTPRLVDRNRDGVITAQELADYIGRYGYRRRIRLMPASTDEKAHYPTLLSPDVVRSMRKKIGYQGGSHASADRTESKAEGGTGKPEGRPLRPSRKFAVSRARLPASLPSWFRLRDRDGDGQVSLAEYDPHPTEAAWREFALYDADSDGLITPQECLRAAQTRRLADRHTGSAQERFGERTVPRPEGPMSSEEQTADQRDQSADIASPSATHRTLSAEELEARRRQKELLRKQKLHDKVKSDGKLKSSKSSQSSGKSSRWRSAKST